MENFQQQKIQNIKNLILRKLHDLDYIIHHQPFYSKLES